MTRSRARTLRGKGIQRSTLPVIVLCLALPAAGCGPEGRAGGEGRGESAGEPSSVTVYVSDEDGVAQDCAAVRPISWDRPGAHHGDLASEAGRRVIRDVRASSSLHPEGTAPLSEYFLEVRVEAGAAVVSFEGGALAYLNSTACMQAATKAPIIRTLLAFTEIDEVAWEIDGKIFDAWDA